MDQYKELMSDLANDIAQANNAYKQTQEVIKKAQKKSPKRTLPLISALAITTTAIGLLYTTNQSLKEENQVLREQSAPLYQHANTIIYPDPICSDDLIVTYNGVSLCEKESANTLAL